MPPESNVWLGHLGWFGPSYPEAGDPPVPGFGSESDDGMPDLDELNTPGPPARHGSGSSRPDWLAYAQAHDVTVPDGASRNAIIDACAAAGVPVD
jgi:hypothetical protein